MLNAFHPLFPVKSNPYISFVLPAAYYLSLRALWFIFICSDLGKKRIDGIDCLSFVVFDMI